MTFKVVLLQSAQIDLKALRQYIVKRFCARTWQVTYEQLKATIRLLAEQPHCGSVPPELEILNLSQFQQVVSGMNRIIYEVRSDIIYVHVIVDSRQSLELLLTHRLLRTDL